MSQELWGAVDQYIGTMLVEEDAALKEAIAASAAAKLPEIQVAPAAGKFLHMLAKLCQARRILEIGTLGGYSAIWMARALPAGGKLITLEADGRHAEVARRNIARANLEEKVEIRVGLALETLPTIEKEKGGAFDLFFIDADKSNNPTYFAWAMKLARPGSLIVVDNVVRKGAIIDSGDTTVDVMGTRRLYEAVRAEKRVMATALQMVGGKGYDGMILAIVNQP